MSAPIERTKVKRKKIKPFRAWMVVDDNGTYRPEIFLTRQDAVYDKLGQSDIKDGKFRVVRVWVSQ